MGNGGLEEWMVVGWGTEVSLLGPVSLLWDQRTSCPKLQFQCALLGKISAKIKKKISQNIVIK